MKKLNLLLLVLFVLGAVLVVHSMGRQAYLHYASKGEYNHFTIDVPQQPDLELSCLQNKDPYAPALWCHFFKKEQ